jgi:hypothetical protein
MALVVKMSAKTTITRMRAVAAAHGGELRLRDLDRALSVAARFHFGSIHAARTAARLARPSRRVWNDAKILRELRRLHRLGVRISRPGLCAAGHDGLSMAAHHYLGGMRRARSLAGIPEPSSSRGEREPWDADRVVAEILARRARAQSVAFSRVPLKLRLAGRRYFGSWRAAIEGAGLDYGVVRLKRAAYTADDLVVELRKLAKAEPDLTRGAFARQHQATFKAVLSVFGDVDAALRAAHLTSWPRREKETWGATRVLRELRRARRQGARLPPKLVAACGRMFGSVAAAERARPRMPS